MILDNELVLSEGQDLSQTASSYYSTNVINLGSKRDIGKGQPLYLVGCVEEGFASATTNSTLQLALIQEDDTTLDGDSEVVIETAPIPEADLKAGKVIAIPLPAGIMDKQYIGVKYTIGTATTTAGKMTTFLALQPPLNP
jgi:hypothetical protein